MSECVEIPLALPGVRAVRMTASVVGAGVKEHHAVARVERGVVDWWARGKVWRSGPGSVLVKEPGDVYRNLAYHGETVFTAVLLPEGEVARAREAGKVVTTAHLDADDARAAPFHRLHDAVSASADAFTLEVAVTEAVATLAKLSSGRVDHTLPVRRAMGLLRERLADPLSLDDLAAHAGLDKFHLCRAFRAQIGMPPHAYLTHLRVQRARELLAQGVRASELAPRVGLYDQSALTRHFRKIMGVTPGKYASAVGAARPRPGLTVAPVCE